MTRRINLDQWHDRTEEPVIVWTYTGYWELEPVAVDDSHGADWYDEITRAFYAAGAFMTFDEVCEEYADDLTPDQIAELYSRGDGSAERAGLPSQYYAEGCNEDGSDPIIYITEETFFSSNRESLAEATPHLDPEDVAEIYRAILETRAEYDA